MFWDVREVDHEQLEALFEFVALGVLELQVEGLSDRIEVGGTRFFPMGAFPEEEVFVLFDDLSFVFGEELLDHGKVAGGVVFFFRGLSVGEEPTGPIFQ